MAILEALFGKRKKLELEDVRYEQKRLELRENNLLKKIEQLARDKDAYFRRGAEVKSRPLRRIYARKFEELTRQMQLEERELARIGKEIRLVSRLRMALERSSKHRSTLPILERLNEGQMQEIMKLIDSDNIKESEFAERLDILLGLTEPGQVIPEVGDEGMEVIKIWEKMDEGEFGSEEGLREATRAITREPRKEREAESPS